MKTIQKGFTLIGILAAIAIPAYQDYTIRAQVSEGLSLASPAKTAVAEFFLNRGVAPTNRAEAGMEAGETTTNGQYVSSLLVTNGTITIAYGQANANSEIQTDVLTLIPYTSADFSVVWYCGDSAATPLAGHTIMDGAAVGDTTLAAKYLPATCRG
jgi:type IV pilus assembly protein PilA